MDASRFFNEKAFSDITIKFADREIPCHKVTLCSNSEYFRKLLGPDSPFAESEQKAIELHEDDPEALYAALAFLYGRDHNNPDDELDDRETQKVVQDTVFQLMLCITADKYELLDLKKEAFEAFRNAAFTLVHVKEIINILRLVEDYGLETEAPYKRFVESVIDKHRVALLRDEEYRAVLDTNKTLMWSLVDSLLTSVDAGSKSVWLCRTCLHHYGRLYTGKCAVCYTERTHTYPGTTVGTSSSRKRARMASGLPPLAGHRT